MLALLFVPAAAGAWSAGGGGSTSAGAATMPVGATPAATGVLATVTVSWVQATIAGAPVAAYVVRRYATVSGTESPVAGGCAGVVAAMTCTDSNVPPGSWVYSITPVHGPWTGTAGPRSLPVVTL